MQERFTQVIAGVVVLLAVVAIVLFSAQARRNSSKLADREFAVAMNQFQTGQVELAGTAFATMADQYSGRRIGQLSMYFLAQAHLAQLRYQEAIEAYDRYLTKAGSEAEFSQSARIAKGYCYEGLRQYRRR